MNPRAGAYERWISAHASGNVTGLCERLTEAMARAFPELDRVVGLYVDGSGQWGSVHCWCVDPDERIVDPSARQFGSGEEAMSLSGPPASYVEIGRFPRDRQAIESFLAGVRPQVLAAWRRLEASTASPAAQLEVVASPLQQFIAAVPPPPPGRR